MFSNYEILQMPLSLKMNRTRVEKFLNSCGLRLDDIDYYAVAVDSQSGEILAGGGFKDDIIKCVAVDERLRGTGVSQELLSHLISQMNSRGSDNIKVFTKPGNAMIFQSLGFKMVGESEKAILLENSMDGISSYVNYLKSKCRDGKNGVIVMNCNPLTLGHKHLIEYAQARVDNLYVIVVAEDKSLFSTQERLDMVKALCKDINNVVVCHGSDYIISSSTFPSYFIKEKSDAALAQIELDLDIMARHIAPALNASVRFVGCEPIDELTRAYNDAMKRLLPKHGIKVEEIERLSLEGEVVSASHVRDLMKANKLGAALQFVPMTSMPYLVALQAGYCLRQELDLTPKPGLIDTRDSGSHTDMTHETMLASIAALRRHFVSLAVMGTGSELPDAKIIINEGVAAEESMLSATNGINTHRGALFSMGLAIIASCHVISNGNMENFASQWSRCIKEIAASLPGGIDTHGDRASKAHNVNGALAMAQNGYADMLNTWLPFYQAHENESDVMYRALLLIMSQLDDTNVIHRVGFDKAQEVKQIAIDTFNNFTISALERLNSKFVASNISPGGAADMLALTLLIYSIENK